MLSGWAFVLSDQDRSYFRHKGVLGPQGIRARVNPDKCGQVLDVMHSSRSSFARTSPSNLLGQQREYLITACRHEIEHAREIILNGLL